MKKSLNTDKQCVGKIIIYIENIRQSLEHENVKSYEHWKIPFQQSLQLRS